MLVFDDDAHADALDRRLCVDRGVNDTDDVPLKEKLALTELGGEPVIDEDAIGDCVG